MNEPLTADAFDDVPTPWDTPILMARSTEVIIGGALALAIRDAVRQVRRFQFCDLQHVGCHWYWTADQWSAFYDWAQDVDWEFQTHDWVLSIQKITEDTTSDTQACRVFATLGHHLPRSGS